MVKTGTEQRENAVTEKEAAIVLGLSVKTLQAWRWRKRGPAYHKYEGSNSVRYLPSDLEKFKNRSRVEI